LTHEYQIALIRGLITAVLTFLSGFVAALQLDMSSGDAAIAGAVPAIAVLLTRFGGEGTLDTRRSDNGTAGDTDHL